MPKGDSWMQDVNLNNIELSPPWLSLNNSATSSLDDEQSGARSGKEPFSGWQTGDLACLPRYGSYGGSRRNNSGTRVGHTLDLSPKILTQSEFGEEEEETEGGHGSGGGFGDLAGSELEHQVFAGVNTQTECSSANVVVKVVQQYIEVRLHALTGIETDPLGRRGDSPAVVERLVKVLHRSGRSRQ